jgi:hypothetical protein
MLRRYLLPPAILLTVFACTEKQAPPAVVAQDICQRCHQETGHEGLEDAHPALALSCVDCHGGDDTAAARNEAHVSNIARAPELRSMSAIQLDEVDPEFIRFVNPSDPRVAGIGCGATNPAAGGTGCHQDLVVNVERSTHATIVGLITAPRYNGGLQSVQTGIYGASNVVHEGFDATSAPRFAVPELARLPVQSTDGLGVTDMPQWMAHTMAKRCTKCHLGVYGGGTDPKEFGNFRSTGCAACHMVYDDDGLSKSGDPVISNSNPGHPEKHILTSAIPDKQCEHCHWRGNRVGTAYKGWRERPSGGRDNKENTLRNPEPLHTRGTDFFILDEDTTNNYDETPPDIHFSLGMACIDCHGGPDVHGDGFIHSTMDTEGGIECEDCHGDFETKAAPQGGKFLDSRGFPLNQLIQKGDDVKLIGRLDGKEHPVTQTVELTSNRDLAQAHDKEAHGELECYACHTAWSQNCYGCHTNIDMRKTERNLLDGKTSNGKTAGNRDEVTLDNLHLAINTDGKIGIFMVQNMFFSVIVPCDPTTSTATCTVDADSANPGRKLIDSQVRRAANGKVGFSWGPGVPHTTADRHTVQTCDRCHLREDGSNETRVRLTYGFGDGSYTFTDGTTDIEYDLTQMIDANGEPVVAFAHPGTRPISMERIQKALDHRVP